MNKSFESKNCKIVILLFALSITCISCAMSESQLAKVAIEGKDWKVRKAAVEKLTDQEVIAKVAIEDLKWYVRWVAVEKLMDQEVLAKVAIKDRDNYVREAALKKLTDQEVLAKVAIEGKDWKVREAAVRKLMDQEVLAKVAIEVLAKVAIEGSEAAVEKLTDQEVIARVAIEGKNLDVCKAALKKLTDKAMLEKVAIEQHVHESIRQTALLNANYMGSNIKIPGGNYIYLTKTIRNAIQHPVIAKRFPGARVWFSWSETRQSYMDGSVLRGECIKYKVYSESNILAAGRWETILPGFITSGQNRQKSIQNGQKYGARRDIAGLVAQVVEACSCNPDELLRLKEAGWPFSPRE